jgi:PAS domain S-box-containing protein
VLIVEDEALIAMDHEATLGAAGARVVGVCGDARSARAQLERHAVDVVLLDVNLRGDEDGVSLARSLAEQDVGVVFVTAYGDEATVRRATDTHPYGFLVKPVEPRSLIAAVWVAFERVRAERESQWLQRAFEAAGVALMVAEGGDRPSVVHVNSGLRRLVGVEDEESLRGRLPWNVGLDSDATEVSRVREAIESGRAHAEVVPCRDHTGRRFFAHVAVAPLPSDTRAPRVAIVFVDVTSKLSFEAALSDNQRLVLVGRLAAGLAHDLNNLLSVVVSFSELVGEELGEDPRWTGVLEDLRQIISAGTRAGLLSRRLLGLARRKSESQVEQLELGEALADARRVVAQACGPRVSVEVRPGLGRTFVRFDRVELEQILLNFATNARDAEATRLVVEVVESADTAEARLRISDDGLGMPPEIAAHVFEPLFTTKGEAGTGLGLYNVQTLIRRAGGQVRLETEKGTGTSFLLELPRVSILDPSTPEHTATPRLDDLRCFVLDRDPTVRLVLQRVLHAAGAEVVALERVGEIPRLVAGDVVVCDELLEGAHEALERVDTSERGRWLLTSAGAHTTPFVAGCLLKPFAGSTLVRRVRGLVTSLRPKRAPSPEPVRRSDVHRALAPGRPLVGAHDWSRAAAISLGDRVRDLGSLNGDAMAAWLRERAPTHRPHWIALPSIAELDRLAARAPSVVLVLDAIRLAAHAERLSGLRKLGFGIALVGDEAATDLALALEEEPDYFLLPATFSERVVLSSGWADLVAASVAVLRRRGIDVVGCGVRSEGEGRALVDLGCDLLEGPSFDDLAEGETECCFG